MIKLDAPISQWIKQTRVALDLTQIELGDLVGCSAEYIRKIEHGTRRPSKEIAMLLAEALRVPRNERENFIAMLRATKIKSDRFPKPTKSYVFPTLNSGSNRVKLIGRARELVLIRRLFANPDCRLITIFGCGGVGKTELALSAIKDQPVNFPDGVIVAMLESVPSADLLPSSLAAALKLPNAQDIIELEPIIDFLRKKQLLLVLDNFEQLMEATPVITQILDATEGIKLLVTSRERLKIKDEWVIDLEGLSYPMEDEPVADHHDAINLFHHSARRIMPTLSFSENESAIASICRQVDGLPLAIDIAVSWLRYLSCQEIADNLSEMFLTLASTNRDVQVRHRSIKTVFDQSWRLLTHQEQRSLVLLTTFPKHFSSESALNSAGVTYTDLLSLVDKSLLKVTANSQFEMNRFLRFYALELVVKDEESTTKIKKFDAFNRGFQDEQVYLTNRERIFSVKKLGRENKDHDDSSSGTATQVS